MPTLQFITMMTFTSCICKPPCAWSQWQSVVPPSLQTPHSLRLPRISPCLVVALGLAIRITWTQCQDNPIPCVVSWQSYVGYAYHSLYPCLYFISLSTSLLSRLYSKLLQMPGKWIAEWGMEDAPRCILVNVISGPWRAVPGVVARKLFVVASSCLWHWGSIQNPTGGRNDKISPKKLCSEIPSPRSAGAKLYTVPFKDQIASGLGWLS